MFAVYTASVFLPVSGKFQAGKKQKVSVLFPSLFTSFYSQEVLRMADLANKKNSRGKSVVGS